MVALLLLVACGADPVDADADGSPAAEDCDDTNPFVYPGAPDDPGDGLDADCADGDPPYAWTGDWTLDEMSATYAGLSLFEDGSMAGTMQLGDDGTVVMDIGGTTNADVVGGAYPITVALTGTWSPMDGPDLVTLYAEGENFDEMMHAALDCAVVDGELDCAGELKALDISLDAEGTFVRP